MNACLPANSRGTTMWLPFTSRTPPSTRTVGSDLQNLLHPGAGRIDDRAGTDLERFARCAVARTGRASAPFSARSRHETRPRMDRRPALRGIQRVQHDQAAVVDPAIGIGERVIDAGAQRAVTAGGDAHAARGLQTYAGR